jgi:hypothetical protein
MAFSMEEDEPLDPLDVGLLRTEAVVFDTDSIPNQIGAIVKSGV